MTAAARTTLSWSSATASASNSYATPRLWRMVGGNAVDPSAFEFVAPAGQDPFKLDTFELTHFLARLLLRWRRLHTLFVKPPRVRTPTVPGRGSTHQNVFMTFPPGTREVAIFPRLRQIGIFYGLLTTFHYNLIL